MLSLPCFINVCFGMKQPIQECLDTDSSSKLGRPSGSVIAGETPTHEHTQYATVCACSIIGTTVEVFHEGV